MLQFEERVMRAQVEELMLGCLLESLSLDREEFLELVDDFQFVWTQNGKFLGISAAPVNFEVFKEKYKKEKKDLPEMTEEQFLRFLNKGRLDG